MRSVHARSGVALQSRRVRCAKASDDRGADTAAESKRRLTYDDCWEALNR
jgi:hypothetical protein